MIRQWIEFVRRPEVRSRVVFLSDYDLLMAEQLVQGVDLGLDTRWYRNSARLGGPHAGEHVPADTSLLNEPSRPRVRGAALSFGRLGVPGTRGKARCARNGSGHLAGPTRAVLVKPAFWQRDS